MKATTDSRHLDETSISVKKEWVYLYRAVDSDGKTLDFWLSPTRDGEAAKRFFLKTLAASHTSEPRMINVDKDAAYETAWRTLQGCEIMNMRRKGQLKGVAKGDVGVQVAFVAKLFGAAT